MGEGHDHHQYKLDYQDAPPVLRRNRRKLAIAGEIVEVQGGHIVRSTGRKDRHSKVCTAKGPRDRRVRLSAHTAIQFYDVQDRLGYDRPSKAVDWLIMNAKAAIDELAELPPWHPTATVPTPSPGQETQLPETIDSTRNTSRVEEYGSSCAYTFDGSAGFLRSSSLQYSDTVADTIKCFFPNQQDLRLSLQSIHCPIPPTPEQALFNTVQANWQEQNAATAPSPWSLAVPTSPGENQFFTQREPLQSSNNTVSTLGLPRQRSASPGLSTTGGFHSGESSGFLIPARIQGEDVHHHGVSDMPFSASSASHR